jgi:hypothetical protein
MKKRKFEYDGEEVERMRSVRRQLEKKYKTIDGLFEYFKQFERKTASTAKATKSRPRAESKTNRPTVRREIRK